MIFIFVLLFAAVVTGDRFVGIGDWGSDSKEQFDTAKALSKWCRTEDCDFIVSLGDNFYTHGVKSVDDIRFKLTWKNIYKLPAIRDLMWYVVLGNHDHKGCAECQVEYSKKEPRWYLPNLWYDKKFMMDNVEVHLIAIDTNTFVTNSSKYKEQLHWLRKTLKRSNSHWKIVVGHHPPYTVGSHFPGDPNVAKDVVPLLEKHGVDLFLMGHDHNLQHIRNVSKDSKLDFVISGGGGMVTHSEEENAKEYLHERGHDLLYFYESNGFVDVEVKRNKLMVRYVATKTGQVIYEFERTKSRNNKSRFSN